MASPEPLLQDAALEDPMASLDKPVNAREFSVVQGTLKWLSYLTGLLLSFCPSSERPTVLPVIEAPVQGGQVHLDELSRGGQKLTVKSLGGEKASLVLFPYFTQSVFTSFKRKGKEGGGDESTSRYAHY